MRFFISGLTTKRLLLSVFFLLLAGMVFGEKITVTPPHFTSTGDTGDIVDKLNEEAKNAFSNLEEINDMLGFLPDDFSNLTGGFANASVFSSDGASQRGYEGYDRFSFTLGFMGGVQLPQLSFISKIADAISNSNGEIEPDLLEEIANVSFGFDPQILNAQFGINSSFLLKGLYLGFKFSKFDTNWLSNVMPLSGFSFSTLSIGVNASYQLISQKRLLAGLLVWRGLNLGTGFIWQNTTLKIKPDISLEESIPIEIEGLTIYMPVSADDIHLDFETNNYIVPINAMTSIRLLGLNVALGAGVDLAFGSSKIDLGGSINVNNDDVNTQLQEYEVRMDTPPELKMKLVGESRTNFLNLKAMFAVGLNFGPIIIDIPLTYYFANNGYSVGVTLGVTL
jgi:hypothetical protein